ncbi:hypothetical protein HID58_034672, partial [Brassica napus]
YPKKEKQKEAAQNPPLTTYIDPSRPKNSWATRNALQESHLQNPILTLQHRLTEALDRKAQINPWRQHGNKINPSQVRVIIKKLRDPDQSLQTLQASEWMRKGRICGPTPEDFEKMREVGLRMKASPFNSMLSLREMEENNVAPDSLMVNEVLKIYAAESKVESMARFMRMWSGEEGIKLERETMAAMANAYAKAGSTKKAIEMYGESKGEVHRLWEDECKKKEKLEADEYRNVISSLLKLDDVEGAEKVYGEWEPDGPKLDLSIPGLLISRKKRIESWGVDEFDWKEEKWDALKDGSWDMLLLVYSSYVPCSDDT